MAAKFNTKFILVLVTVVAAAALVVGALALIAMRGNADRNITSGDESMAAGDYEQAVKDYGRAVSKEKSNIEYLDKFQQALEMVRPETEADAREKFRLWWSAHLQRTRILPGSINVWMPILQDAHRNAQLISSRWPTLREQSEEALRHINESVDGYDQVKLLNLIALRHGSSTLIEEERVQFEQDFIAYIDSHPGNIEAITNFGGWLAQQSDRASFARQSEKAKERYKQAVQYIQRAAEVDANSFDVAYWEAQLLTSRHRRLNRPPTKEERIEAENRVYELAMANNDLRVVSLTSTGLLRYLNPVEGRGHAIEISEKYQRDHPESLVGTWYLARQLSQSGQRDRARDLAQQIIDSEPIPVSFDSMLRFQLRKEAAKLLFDVEVRVVAEDAGSKDDSRLRQARDQLASLVRDPDSNALVIECDAWMAFLAGEYHVAASKFNRALAENPNPGWRVLTTAAEAMRLSNAPGEAVELLLRAKETLPYQSAEFLAVLANLELLIGKVDEALEHASDAVDLDPENEKAKIIYEQVMRQVDPDAEDTGDVKFANQADALMDEGKFDEARELLVEAISQFPRSLRVIDRLSRAEVQTGRQGDAITRLEMLVERFPNEPLLRTLLQRTRGDDPIDTLVQWTNDRYPDELDRRVAMYVNLRRAATGNRTHADELRQQGRPDLAADADELSRRCTAEAEKYLAQLGNEALSHPEFLGQRFSEAIMANDFERAEQLVTKAREIDADQAHGLTYKAKLEWARNNIEEAIVALDDASKITPYSVWIWRTLGQCYERLGNDTSALTAYENAIDRQPNDSITIQLLVRLLDRTGRQDDAMALIRAAAKRPGVGSQVRNVWLGMEAARGDGLLVLQEREKRYVDSPDDINNAISLAVLMGRIIPDGRSVVDARGNRRFSDTAWSSITPAKRTELAQPIRDTWWAEAEKIFASLNADTTGELKVRYARCVFFRDTRRMEQAGALIRDYLDTHAKNGPTPYLVFANFYQELGDSTTAAEILKEGIPYQDNAVHQIDLTLGQMYLQSGRSEEALTHLVRVAEANPNSDVLLKIAEAKSMLRKYEDALSDLEALEASGGVTAITELLRAKVKLGQSRDFFQRGDTPAAERAEREARSAAFKANALAPRDPWPHVMEASILFSEFTRTGRSRVSLLNDADLAISKALGLNATFAPALTKRAEILLAQSPPDYASAIAQYEAMSDANPRDESLRRMVMQLSLRNGDTDRALAAARKGIEIDPQSPDWYLAAGELYRSEERHNQAVQMLGAAWQLQNSDRVLFLLCDSLLRSQPAQDNAVRQLISQNQEMYAQSIRLRTVYARALAQNGNWDDGVNQLEIAFAAYRENGNTADLAAWMSGAQVMYDDRPVREIDELLHRLAEGTLTIAESRSLANLWLAKERESGSSRAVELLEKALATVPAEDSENRSALYTAMGQAYWIVQQYEQAAAMYEQAIAVDPNNVSALNDLAYTYADGLGRATEALPHAEKANELAPGYASVLDTLGAVHLALKNYDEAERILRESEGVRPSADNQYHLGKLHHERGDELRAGQYLRQALKLSPVPQTRSEIEALLDDITS